MNLRCIYLSDLHQIPGPIIPIFDHHFHMSYSGYGWLVWLHLLTKSFPILSPFCKLKLTSLFGVHCLTNCGRHKGKHACCCVPFQPIYVFRIRKHPRNDKQRAPATMTHLLPAQSNMQKPIKWFNFKSCIINQTESLIINSPAMKYLFSPHSPTQAQIQFNQIQFQCSHQFSTHHPNQPATQGQAASNGGNGIVYDATKNTATDWSFVLFCFVRSNTPSPPSLKHGPHLCKCKSLHHETCGSKKNPLKIDIKTTSSHHRCRCQYSMPMSSVSTASENLGNGS